MKPDLERYYEERMAMFATRGWKELIEDVRAMHTSTNVLDGVTPETLKFKQGEVSIMNWLLTLEAHSKEAYADLQLQVSSPSPDGTDHDLRAEDDES